MGESKPRVALLGAREDEIELLAELHRHSRVELVAVYDPDPHAPGLAVAEIAGVATGADLESRQRLASVDFVVLPAQRLGFEDAIDWCSTLEAELVELDVARRRWGSAPTAIPGGLPAAARIEAMDDAGARLASRSELGEWLLDVAMRAVGASGGSVQLLAPQTRELYLIAARGLSENVVRTARHPLGEPISGLTAGMRTPQILHAEQHTRLGSHRGKLSSAMSVPLQTEGGALVGVLNVSTTVQGKRFEARDLAQIEALGPHAARLLSRAHQFESATQQSGDGHLFDTLRELEAQGVELGTSLQTLCNELRGRIGAGSVALYLQTEDGDWLQIAIDTAGGGERAPARRSAAARAYIERTWLHLVEYPRDETSTTDETREALRDPIDAAVDRALAVIPDEGPTLSCVYAPLVGSTPVGVLAATFSSLAPADAFVQHGEPTLRNIALYVETRMRERRSKRELERVSRLGRSLPKLVEGHAKDELETVLVREAALIASAERVLLRHVDEERRTYSRPIVHGVPEAALETWRQLDSRVTERTLERRTLESTTSVHEEGDDLDDTTGYRTLVSVPILQGAQLVAVLNVYDKLPQDPLEGRSFSELDCRLLDDLGRSAASLLAPVSARQPAPELEPQPEPEPEPETLDADRVAPVAPLAQDEPFAVTSGPSTLRAQASPLETDSVRLRDELRREVARAQRHQCKLGVSLMHIKGLRQLDEESRHDLLVEVMRVVRHYTRRSDLVGWYGPDRLMVVSPESDPGGEELEQRLRHLLRDSVPPEARTTLDVRIGSSSYPEDGDDPTALLQTAASRLR